MGTGYIIGCNKCINEEDLKNIWKDRSKIIGTFFYIGSGGVMLLFCKEQLEKRYGVYKNYNRQYRLLAAGDPPDSIYEKLGSATHDENIDKIIYDNIKNGFEFTENLGSSPYYCKKCKKLSTQFYFEMTKNNKMYIPEYICKKCSSVLGIANLVWENEHEKIFEDDECEKVIEYKYDINRYNDIIKIKSTIENNEEELICDNCGNNKFSIMSEMWTD